MTQLELTDFDADHQLLALKGTTLVVFEGAGCASCRWARNQLPQCDLPMDRIAWIDAGLNPGLVARYEVFRLPAMFAVHNGYFYAAVEARLTSNELTQALELALTRPPEELP